MMYVDESCFTIYDVVGLIVLSVSSCSYPHIGTFSDVDMMLLSLYTDVTV